MVPEGWEVKTFSNAGIQLIDGDRGSNYPNENDFSDSGYCLFLSAKNVTKNGFKFEITQFITQEKDLQLSKGKLRKGDIVLTTRGTVGNLAFYNDEVPFQNIRINSGMLILRNTKDISILFLYQQLKSFILNKQIERIVFGSAQPQLTVKEVNKLWIYIPNILEQQKIATILSTLDRTIEATQKLIDKEKMVKKGLMADLLTHGIDKQGRIRSPQTHRYVDSPLGMIPEGWEVKHLSELADIVGGGTPAREVEEYWKNGNIPWATPTDITKEKTGKYIDNTKECITTKGLSSSSAKLIPINSILLTSRANIGFMRLNTKPMATNQGFASVVPFEDNAQFLYYLLDIYVPYMHRRAYGTTFPEISKTEVKNISVVIPKSIDEQQKIATILSAQDRKIETEETNLAKLQNLKKGLMGDLLSGDVRV
jgi:type I restriction enzyme S subunit